MGSTQQMQAIQVHQFGGPEQLRLVEMPRPEPQADEVLVRVYAAGVLPADAATRRGSFMAKTLPYIPGTAFAGVVEAVGGNVTTFKVGDAICGRAPTGSYAEYTTVLANAPLPSPDAPLHRLSAYIIPLARLPQNGSFAEAATLSGGATTAWTALFADGGLQAGQRALIHGAAGGVGSFAVQLARWKGAHVIGTASGANVDLVRSLGVDTVIDYRTTPFEHGAGEVDFVLDTIGGETLQRSLRLVKQGGTLVSIVEEPDAVLAEALGIHALKNATLPDSSHLRQIVQLIDAGQVKPVIRQRFPLQEARQAHELVETGHGQGRIILEIAP